LRRARASRCHPYFLSLHFLPGDRFNRALRHLFRFKGHKAKAARPVVLPVLDHFRADHGSDALKQRPELVVGKFERKAGDEDFGWHFVGI
jgi:hypothetical protein